MNERQTDGLVGWLILVEWLFETAFQFISICLPEKGREKRETIGERKKYLTTITRTYRKRSRLSSYFYPNSASALKITWQHCLHTERSYFIRNKKSRKLCL